MIASMSEAEREEGREARPFSIIIVFLLDQIVFTWNRCAVKYECVNLLVFNLLEGDSRLNWDRKAI